MLFWELVLGIFEKYDRRRRALRVTTNKYVQIFGPEGCFVLNLGWSFKIWVPSAHLELARKIVGRHNLDYILDI